MKRIYWGKHTKKALENFPIKKYVFPEEFIKNLAQIKAAAAKANGNLKLIQKGKAKAIFEVALEISKGSFKEQFPLSIYQTGSGTSTNMNMNEVISSIVKEKYKLEVHPNDDVNKSQSSNDVIPTAIYLTTIKETKEKLLPSLINLEKYLRKKGKEFHKIITVGRTHLQEAVPISLGDEFYGYAEVIKAHRENIENSLKNLYALPLGGTAVGTGINSHKEFAKLAIKNLKEITGIPLKEGENHFALQSSIGNLSIFSSSLKNLSLDLLKIMRDLKLKNLFGEISIPPLQAGSSIMPGKVNPVSLEVLEQILINLIGNDLKISISSLSGNFELNTYLPLVSYNLI
ncbi:MAG: lyase family protein, partial [Thermoanaerobaculia bacterium]